MPFVRGFLPSLHGFRFPNGWGQFPLSVKLSDVAPFGSTGLYGKEIGNLLLDIPFSNASNGLCGGMVFACADYFRSGLSVPREQPGAGHPLFLALTRRLFDSFNLDCPLPPWDARCSGVGRYLWLMNPALPDHETDASRAGIAPHGRSWVMIKDSWPAIRRSIDRNRLCPLALVRTKTLNPLQLGKNHQVLAYGYELAGDDLTIRIYDPNHPLRDNVHLTLNIGDPQHTVDVRQSTAEEGEELVCFFPTNYRFARPPFVPEGGSAGEAEEVAWIDDVLPPDAIEPGSAEWIWNFTKWPTASGNRIHVTTSLTAGPHGHAFTTRRHALRVDPGDKLFAYVRIDTDPPPISELMLEWRDRDGSWEHRAYWGDDRIVRGTSRTRMGNLPVAGTWIRLQVPAEDVGLDGATTTGMGFHVFGKQVAWDRAGKIVPGIRQRRVRWVSYETRKVIRQGRRVLQRGRVGGVGGWDRDGDSWFLSRRAVVDAIRDGEVFYVERPEGNRTELYVVGTGAGANLRTLPRGGFGNNLRMLPDFDPTT